MRESVRSGRDRVIIRYGRYSRARQSARRRGELSLAVEKTEDMVAWVDASRV